MKSVKLGLFTLLIFVTASGQTFAQDNADGQQKDYSDAFTLIDVWLEAQQAYEDLPGISAIALKDQEVLWEGAYGYANVEAGREMTPETICSICSISKLFTSVSVMNLYEEGKLRLDDKVEDILPWFDLNQQYESSGPITIRTLLTHSSGLPREIAYSHWNGPDYYFPTKEEIIERLSEQETLYPASTYFQYSNLAMALLGFVVEEVSGMPYDEYVRDLILDPLELDDTRTYMPEDMHGAKLAIGYSPMDRDRERIRLNFFEANGVDAAAGFSSTVRDLAAFAAWNFRLYENNDEEILKPATLKNMHNIHWMDSDFGTSWGLGFSVYKGPDGKKWVGHGGYCPGYQSTLALDLENKMAYSVMINSNGVSPEKYSGGIHGILSKAPEMSDDSDSKDLSEYVGFYQFGVGSDEYIGKWGDKLYLVGMPNNDPASSMIMFRHKEGDTFVRIRDNGEDGESLEFIRDEDGNITEARRYNTWRLTRK